MQSCMCDHMAATFLCHLKHGPGLTSRQGKAAMSRSAEWSAQREGASLRSLGHALRRNASSLRVTWWHFLMLTSPRLPSHCSLPARNLMRASSVMEASSQS